MKVFHVVGFERCKFYVKIEIVCFECFNKPRFVVVNKELCRLCGVFLSQENKIFKAERNENNIFKVAEVFYDINNFINLFFCKGILKLKNCNFFIFLTY